MVHKTINSFPTIGREAQLPIYLNSVGCNEYENRHAFPDGYHHHQIYFTSKGEGSLRIGGREYRLKEGMGYFIRAGVAYEHFPRASCWTTWFFSFGGTASESLLDSLEWGDCHIFKKLDIIPLHLALKKMYLLSTEEDFPSRCKTAAQAYDFIMSVFAQDSSSGVAIEAPCESTALLFAKRYIEQYYFSDLSLATLAEFSRVTPQHLCRLFQKHLHMRPVHYLTTIRLRIAKGLLTDTDQSIQEIAEKVGFHNPYYFTNTFKRYEGMSPTQYRIMCKKKKV